MVVGTCFRCVILDLVCYLLCLRFEGGLYLCGLDRVCFCDLYWIVLVLDCPMGYV